MMTMKNHKLKFQPIHQKTNRFIFITIGEKAATNITLRNMYDLKNMKD